MTGSSESSGAGGGGAGLKKGPWTAAEDGILMEYVKKHGEGNWNAVQKNSGLSRCGKSCRLRWANHLRPNLKKGSFSPDEERLILQLHAQLGNKWARMATQLPGRTDNEIKNYWNTRIKRRQRAGLPLYPPEIQRNAAMNHHHHRQSSHPPPPLSDHKPGFSSSPLSSLFDPSNFSAMAAPQRLLGGNPFVNQIPFSPVTTPLFQGKHQIQYSLGNYDYNPPPNSLPTSSFSIQMELPSSQLFSEPDGSGGGGGGSMGRSNSGLLDALLQDGHGGCASQREGLFLEQPAGDQEVKWVHLGGKENNGGLPLLEFNAKWEDSDTSIGIKMKREPTDEVNPVDEDLSGLLDMIPTAAMPATTIVPDWYKCDSGEISNGQSGVTEDDIGLEMQQLASTLSITPEDQDWRIGNCNWNNMPGIC